LCLRKWTSGLHKRQGISWLAVWTSASQAAWCYMKLVTYVTSLHFILIGEWQSNRQFDVNSTSNNRCGSRCVVYTCWLVWGRWPCSVRNRQCGCHMAGYPPLSSFKFDKLLRKFVRHSPFFIIFKRHL
jgi:hypothetical protein